MNIFSSALLLVLLIGAAWADRVQRLESGLTKVHLIELYTSEGCSSCPPAEAWLSRFIESPDLWGKFVPVSFHVDYWDNLGWPDSFASRLYTQRQYQYAAHWNNASVYTPGWVVDGAEQQSLPVPSDLSALEEDVGKLTAEIRDKTVVIVFVPAHQHPTILQCQIALLGSGIRSSILRGENGGRTLEHDFVVLAMNTTTLSSTPGGSIYSTTVMLPGSELSCRRALAVWVEDPSAARPIQAVGGWLR